MYSFETRVGYSLTDNKRNMTIESIINAFQDCSCFQSEHLGVGFSYLLPRNLVWVLNSWQLEIKQYPKFYDKIKVATMPYDLKGFFGYRNFYIEDEAGEKMVTANSIWTLMDWKKQCPAHMEPEMVKAYELEEKLPMHYESRKITIPKTDDYVKIEKEKLQIKRFHLDSNQHVNNGQYIKIALEHLEPDCEFHSLRAEYKRQAVLDDWIVPVIYQKDKTVVIVLGDEAGSPFAIVEVK